jgi:hypothetical protein
LMPCQAWVAPLLTMPFQFVLFSGTRETPPPSLTRRTSSSPSSTPTGLSRLTDHDDAPHKVPPARSLLLLDKHRMSCSAFFLCFLVLLIFSSLKMSRSKWFIVICCAHVLASSGCQVTSDGQQVWMSEFPPDVIRAVTADLVGPPRDWNARCSRSKKRVSSV